MFIVLVPIFLHIYQAISLWSVSPLNEPLLSTVLLLMKLGRGQYTQESRRFSRPFQQMFSFRARLSWYFSRTAQFGENATSRLYESVNTRLNTAYCWIWEPPMRYKVPCLPDKIESVILSISSCLKHLKLTCHVFIGNVCISSGNLRRRFSYRISHVSFARMRWWCPFKTTGNSWETPYSPIRSISSRN